MEIYVGIRFGQRREVFKTDTTPIAKTWGHLYNATIGPFRTMRGARFMAINGGNNPHCQSVSDAERISKTVTVNKINLAQALELKRKQRILELIYNLPEDLDEFEHIEVSDLEDE